MDLTMFSSITDTQIFYSVLCFMWIMFLWETYLSIRQRKIYKTATTVPADVKAVLDEETFHKARLYQLDKSNFGFVKSTFNEFLMTGFLLLNGLRWLWDISGHYIEHLGYNQSDSEIVHSMMFIFLSNTLSLIISLPFSIYSTFVLEEKHGFNKQTWIFFTKDTIKGYLVGQVITIPIVGSIVWIVMWGGDWFFLYLWVFAGVLTLFLMTIYPSVIAPLFDKYTPLPEGELKEKIEALASKIKFPLTKLYVVEGSKRSAHSNAYFYGIFNKRIVLFDTLIQGYVSEEEKKKKEKEQEDKEKEESTEKKEESTEKKEEPIEKKEETIEEKEEPAKHEEELAEDKQSTEEKQESTEKQEKSTEAKDKFSKAKEESSDNEEELAKEKKPEKEKELPKGCTTEEVVAVLGHELGHWKLNHILKNIVICQVNLLLVFAVFGMLYKHGPLYDAFGFDNVRPVLLGLVIVLQFIFAPYHEVLSFLMTVLSRSFEFAADEFAVRLGKGALLRSSLVKLNRDNLGFPIYDPLFSAWHLSHPPLLERLDAITDFKQD